MHKIFKNSSSITISYGSTQYIIYPSESVYGRGVDSENKLVLYALVPSCPIVLGTYLSMDDVMDKIIEVPCV